MLTLLTLLDATALLVDNARITVPDGLGSVEAQVRAIDLRGPCPVLIAVTDDDRAVVVPLDDQPAGDVS